MQLTKKNIYKIILFVISFLLFVFSVSPFISFADESKTYSSVLDDLKKDSSFILSDYELDTTDYSLQLITVSESINYELFVYVYIPSGDIYNIKATSINISQKHKDVEFANYTLTLISSDGLFHKYRVDGLLVKYDAVRYYEISSIFRPFNATFGDKTDSASNIVTERSYPVGKAYKLTDNLSDGYELSVEDIDLITVTDRYVGFFRYPNGGWFNTLEAVDVHFIAFTTDKRMDYLYEADLTYTMVTVCIESAGFSQNIIYGNPVKKEVSINYKKDMQYTGDGWGAAEYSWKSIEKASDFIISEEKGQHYTTSLFDVTTNISILSGAKSDIESKDWVIRFDTTSYDFYENANGSYSRRTSTAIGDVSILRLAFKTDGVSYNLGVVDNKTTGSNQPGNDESETDIVVDFLPQVKALFIILIVGLLFAMFSPILGPLLSLLLKVFLWLVCFPFNFLSYITKAVRKHRYKK